MTVPDTIRNLSLSLSLSLPTTIVPTWLDSKKIAVVAPIVLGVGCSILILTLQRKS